MLQLNLLPDVKKEFLRAERQRNLVVTICIIAAVTAVGIVIILGVAMGAQAVQKNVLMGNIDRDKQTIKQYQVDKQLNEYLTVQNQLSQIDNLKAGQPIYSRLFDYLRQLNPAAPNSVELSSARVASATADGSLGVGTIELQGTTSDFASLDAYKTTLQRAQITYSASVDGDAITEPLFNSVTVSEAGISENSNGEDGVSFTIQLQYNEAAFKVNSVNVILKIPQETTSNAINDAPKSVFNDAKGSENE